MSRWYQRCDRNEATNLSILNLAPQSNGLRSPTGLLLPKACNPELQLIHPNVHLLPRLLSQLLEITGLLIRRFNAAFILA